MQEFGALIKRARESQGMTQEDVGRIMGRPHSFLTRYERGEPSNPPDPVMFDALSRVLEVSKRDMLIALGYLDPATPEPGIAYAVPEKTARATLLDAVRDAPDELIRLVANHAEDIIQTFGLARLGHSDYRDISSQSIKDRSTNRSA